jgi:glycosyltransferase involved in cell wall biosynthesis
MKLGIAILDTWAYFDDIYALFKAEHQTTVFIPQKVQTLIFSGRINRKLYTTNLESFLKNNRVCFFEWSGEYLAHATNLAKRNGIVTRLHRYELYQWADKINWEKVDRVILVSEAKRREIETRFPAVINKTIVIPEGINLEKFNFSPKPFRKQLGILCHLSPRKRVYELILAFVEGNFHKQGYTLHIGGGSHPKFLDYNQALQSLVDQLDVRGNVIFHGHVSNQNNWFDGIDIFISNSYSEGLQVSPMEAMARGCFCLSHRWEGAEELLPEAFLFGQNSELIQKIQTYADLSEDEKLHAIAQQRQIVEEKFNIKNVAQSVLKVVNEVAEIYP